MDILVYNWRDKKNPDAGGAEVFTHNVLERLADKGHNVTLFTAKFDGAPERETVNGVDIVRAGNKYTVYRQARKYYKNEFAGTFDVVVDEINTRPFNTPQYVDEPVVALIHQLAAEFWHYEMPFPLDYVGRYALEPYWLSQYTDTPTITVSNSSRKDLERRGFTNVTQVPEGIDIEPLDAVPDKPATPTFLYVGRMKRTKKPEDALQAFQHIQEQLPDAQLHMVGDGPRRTPLQQQYAADNDAITFHGYVDGDRKRALMQNSHVLLVPGVREGWGLVVTEANAMGTPAAGYNIPGLRDSINHRETGRITAPTPDALAHHAVALYHDHDRHAALALNDAKQYDWDTTAAQIEEHLKHVVQHQTGSRTPVHEVTA